MSIVWVDTAEHPSTETILQTGGFFVSSVLRQGDVYDLAADLLATPPSFATGEFEVMRCFARVCLDIQPPVPSVNLLEGFPPRQVLGSVTVGANPTYITEHLEIRYLSQYLGHYEVTEGNTYPTVVSQDLDVPILNTGSSHLSFHPLSLRGGFKPGSVFYIQTPDQDIRLRLRGALVPLYRVLNPRQRYFFAPVSI